ncbi:MAG: hypothetical protein ACFE75_08710, partial [Candidatus Hodarchaeota archaeon]
SIAMILDGKMFESKLKEELIKRKYSTAEYERNLKDFSIEQIISKTKLCFDNYIETWGKGNTIKKNGNVMWKPMQWMWNKNRKILQEYIQLTEFLSLPVKYKQETGKDHIYNEELTLYYIRWLYQQKIEDLTKFMTKIFPVL